MFHLHHERLEVYIIATVLFALPNRLSPLLLCHCLVLCLVSTTMPSLPNELWLEILAHAIPLDDNLAMVKPSLERLSPFYPGSFSRFSDKHFYSSQVAIWKRSNMVAHSIVQVNRLWRGIAERFLYSAFYVEEEWRVRRFVDTVKLNPNLADQLRTLVIMFPIPTWTAAGAYFDPLVVQVLSLCHSIVAIVMASHLMTNFLPPFQSLNSSPRLLLLSASDLPNEQFFTFMINFNNYASLQVLDIYVSSTGSRTLPLLPDYITFPSLHTLVLNAPGIPPVIDVVGKWELPSLKKLDICLWSPFFCTPLFPLIQRSYDRLESFSTSLEFLHAHGFHEITRAPPLHLRHVTLDIEYSSPPMDPATKPLFGHVVTLGIRNFATIRPEDVPEWIRFFSDPTYMPHLRSVLTDATKCLLVQRVLGERPLFDVVRSFEKVLEDRGVAFKGVMGDLSIFVPIKPLQRDIAEVSMSLFGI
jgi:hypothetical protein